MCLYLCEHPSTARTSPGLRFHKHNNLSELKELGFNLLWEFLNRGQASHPGFDDGGPRIQDTLHFPQRRNNKEIAGDNSWHRIACRTKNSWGWCPLGLLWNAESELMFYSNFILKDSTELSMPCAAYRTGCRGVWQGALASPSVESHTLDDVCWGPALTRIAPPSSGPTICLCSSVTFVLHLHLSGAGAELIVHSYWLYPHRALY